MLVSALIAVTRVTKATRNDSWWRFGVGEMTLGGESSWWRITCFFFFFFFFFFIKGGRGERKKIKINLMPSNYYDKLGMNKNDMA